ncbi:MAG: hypothetical protein WBB37_07640 [bacterium]
MLCGDRIWKFLAGFLKRKDDGIIKDICESKGAALDETITAADKLKPQSLANRLVGYPEYYNSEDRKRDLSLIGSSRFVFKRDSESWDDFETRLQQFPNDIPWFGTKKGIITEIERTGLVVDSIEEMRDDPMRFIILSFADQCAVPEDQISHVFALGEEEETVRGTRTYGRTECEDFIFLVYLSGETDYSKAEVKTIIKLSKPPYTKAYVFFPGESVAEEVV